jgi:hypothetical protein
MAKLRVGANAGEDPAERIVFSTTAGARPRFSASCRISARPIMKAAL